MAEPWLCREAVAGKVKRLELDVAPGLSPSTCTATPEPGAATAGCSLWLGTSEASGWKTRRGGSAPHNAALGGPCSLQGTANAMSVHGPCSGASHLPTPNLAAPPAPGSELSTAPQTPPRAAHAAQRCPEMTAGTL